MSAARTDSDAGSVNPPAESALVTGNPNIPHTTITSTAATMTRLGAATATRAIRCRIVSAIGAGGAAGPSAMPGAGIDIFDNKRFGRQVRLFFLTGRVP